MELPLRRRAWLSREGWYYAAVLAFIVGGAVLRNVNLLVVLAGMMVAPLVLNWRLVMASLRGLTVRRMLPPHSTAGEPFTVEVAVTNHRSSFSSWLLRVSDRVERIDADGVPSLSALSLRSPASWKRLIRPIESIQADALLQQAPASAVTTASYRLTIHRRGRYRFGRLSLSTRYPLGLVRGHVQFDQPAELIVAPRLGRLTEQWNELTQADQMGDERRHPQRGFTEGDYYGLRPWQTGDSQRWIHWRTTAKLNTPTVRQFERQQSHDLAIVLDPWLPDAPQQEDLGRLELAVSLAATALAEMGQRGGTLTFAVAGSSPQVWIAPASDLLVEEILLALASVAGGPATDWRETLAQLEPSLSAAGPLLAISPRSQAQWQAAQSAENDAEAPADAPLRWIDVGSAKIGELFVLD